ncbi:hypothetical protein phiOC_p248 [Ochrobactrum phage vB_OspM_OC]|nr:hypothetical protein phiOC_p248 [Ochrobactrum phage vB_OspM_OC]
MRFEMNQSQLLFEKFCEMLERCNSDPDQKLFKIMIDDFNNLYKRCDGAIQGEYHGMVSEYMNAIS